MATIKPILAGVCAWLAQKMNIDVAWVRIAAVVATVLAIGSPVVVYLVIWIMLRLRVIQ